MASEKSSAESATTGGRSPRSRSAGPARTVGFPPATLAGMTAEQRARFWKAVAKNQHARRLHAVARQLELRRELERERSK